MRNPLAPVRSGGGALPRNRRGQDQIFRSTNEGWNGHEEAELRPAFSVVDIFNKRHGGVGHGTMAGEDDSRKGECRVARMNGDEIKVVGKSGQISIGKSYAGKTLRLQRREDGSILITSVAMVPESELWTLEEPNRSRIARGLTWASETAPAETDLDALMKRRSGKPAHARRVRRK